MADSVVFSMINSVTGRLSALVKTLVGSSSKSPCSSSIQNFAELDMMMQKIQLAIEDANASQLRSYTQQLRLAELREVAYDIEDLVDDYNYEVMKLQVERRGKQMPGNYSNLSYGEKEKVSDMVTEPLTMVPVVDGLDHKVNEIKKRFNEITSAWEGFSLKEVSRKRRRIGTSIRIETTSLVNESIVVGRVEDKERLINLLLLEDQSGESMLSVIPIIGMGGIGKTTLAQIVCNDPKVYKNFDLVGWVCVSQDSDITSLTRKIAVSLLKQELSFSTPLNYLQFALKEGLKGKRFLLVIDDVWSEDPSLWVLLRSTLTSASCGKVLVTTRNASVARVMQTVAPVEVSFLSLENSWVLFKNYAFACLDVQHYANLAEIGLNIVKRCKGLPLAIRVLAAALQYESDEEIWLDILDSELWDLDGEEGDILPALRLSYDQMPLDLKQCFTYLSLIPKGTPIDKNKMIQMWVSQGFLEPATTEPEYIGNNYFHYLLDRSILQEHVDKSYHLFFGDPIYELKFFLHDLIHDLAQSVALGDYLGAQAHSSIIIPPKLRHLSLVSNIYETTIDLNLFRDSKYLRTMIITGQSYLITGLDQLFPNLSLIRALDLSHADIKELPDSIANFKHLRYLSLAFTRIRTLPESICDLFYLHTLNLQILHLQELPKGIGNLINLCHLQMIRGRVCMPPGIGELINLKTLSFFMIGRSSWHCGIRELKGLTNLKGELSINQLQNVLQSDYLKKDKYLKDMALIESLQLEWEGPPLNEDCSHRNHGKHDQMHVKPYVIHEPFLAECVLESLEPNTNLKRLEISSYNGAEFPHWVCDASYTNLDTLALSYCSKECKTLPPLGQLPSLRNLIISSMEGVECIGHELCARDRSVVSFPSLKSLDFRSMPRLEKWFDLIDGDFPCLEKLNIEHCQQLKSLPQCLPSSLVKLTIYSSGVKSITMPPLLKNIILNRCGELLSVEGLANLNYLESLAIDHCPKLNISPSEKQLINNTLTF